MNNEKVIGLQLKKLRKRLGLTQDEMTRGIINKSHYSRIERGLEGISAQSLFKILFVHAIDVEDFLDDIKNNYRSEEDIEADKLENMMMVAFNKSDTDKIKQYLEKILQLHDHKILKYRSIISIAAFEGKLNELSSAFKKQIITNFTDYSNWVENVDSLKLFGNCLQVFSLEQLDIYMIQLLRHYSQNTTHSEKMLERVAMICNNYLYYCYFSNINGTNINVCLTFLTTLDDTNHFLFYKICGKFYYYLFNGQIDKAKEIKVFLVDCGYANRVLSWQI